MEKEIPLSVPNLNSEIVENLKECVETGWVSTGGRFIREFEEAVAAYAGVKETVACQSGTAGLHTALRILGVGAGDEVLVPTLTFIAAVNPVKYLGAEPVFLDCDESLCIDPAKLETFCRDACRIADGALINQSTGRRVAALVVVHVFGNLADMERIMAVARRYGLKVLEDATEALGSFYTGGRYRGKHAGAVGDMGVYSFNANKIITTGGGGMILSGSGRCLRRARYLTTTARDDGLYFIHNDVGYNYRMLNLQAALGVSQIKELEGFIEKKTANFHLYEEQLAALGIEGVRLLPHRAGVRSNHWFYAFQIDAKALGLSRDDLAKRLIEKGIQCRPVWKLCHRQRPYRRAQRFQIRRALHYEKTIINLPCSTSLTPADVIRVCEAIAERARPSGQPPVGSGAARF